MSREPKYKQVLNYLTMLVENGSEMDKLPTEKELSHRFGVSHITVRRALSELEKSSLIVRLPGKGTFIRNRSFPLKTLKYLVILPPGRTSTTGYFIPPIISGIFSAEMEDKFDIQTLSYNYDFSEILNLCAGSGVNGVIWITPDMDQLNFVKELEKFSYPVIGINRVEKGINYVSIDHEKSSEEITDFLIKKGHKKIGFVGFCEELSYIRQRYNGFLNAFKKAEIDFDEKSVVKMTVTRYRPFEFDELRFKKDFLNMYENYKPSAIFVLGSGLIEMVLDTIIEKNISIPDNLEVVTFDKVPEKYEQKRYIHEIIQPLFNIGRIAGEYLEKLIKDKVEKVEITLPCRLILKPDRR
ncbi:MAG: GntR family transcriptional regulator [Candidatus Omnitrophica bacterium]|nr:GntR family transcriptional regulator [Candidatus Omnitrophota bacterium]